MKISVVIPTYNDAENLENCLSAISSSDYKPYEVNVVDDASEDQIKEIADKFGCRYIRLDRNSGQATARNTGAKIAKGDILFFIDSDVKIRKDTIGKVAEAYKNPDVMIYQGIASKKPLNRGFAPELLASKWYFMLYKTKEASIVHSHIFSIRKSVFNEVGGFAERFRHPGGGEEFELGHRLREKYVIYVDPQLLVEHDFQTFFPRTRSLYKRAFVWAGLFSKTKKFEKTVASAREAIIGVFDILVIASLIFSFFHTFFLYLSLFFFIIQTSLNSSFYLFILKEKGLIFMLKAILPNMIWSSAQVLGAIDYYLRRTLGLVK